MAKGAILKPVRFFLSSVILLAAVTGAAFAQAGPGCAAISRDPLKAAAAFPVPKAGRVARYAVKSGSTKVTELERVARDVSNGVVTWRDSYLGPNHAGAQRETSEFYGLFVTRVMDGTQAYTLSVGDLSVERFGKLLKSKKASLKGEYVSTLGGRQARGGVDIKVSYRGCSGPVGRESLNFEVTDTEDGKSTATAVTLDVKTGVVISSRKLKGTSSLELIRP